MQKSTREKRLAFCVSDCFCLGLHFFGREPHTRENQKKEARALSSQNLPLFSPTLFKKRKSLCSGGRKREKKKKKKKVGRDVTTAFLSSSRAFFLSFSLSLSLSLSLLFCVHLSPYIFRENCERKRKKHVDASPSETVGDDDGGDDGERSGTGDE